MLAGDLTAADLLAAADDDRQRAAAHYWIGRALLLAGHDDGAKDAFTTCLALDSEAILEGDLARACLQQLQQHAPTAPAAAEAVSP